MKFLMTYAQDPAHRPTPETIAKIERYTKEMIERGVVLMTGGLVRPSQGIKVRLTGEQFSATDGPYAETKELIDGFALIQAASKEEAIQHARAFMLLAGDGEGEILQVFDGGEPSPHC
jgi:hypothetical protein